jgi:protein O-mannosyl-transferase
MSRRRSNPEPRRSTNGTGTQRKPRANREFPRWLLATALVVAVFWAYQPSWRGGFLWDDDAHVTAPELRSLDGLYRIWFELGATQQYYPLLHSVFWIEHRLWGDATLDYHLVNIALHALAAIMVAAVLRRLAVPGAYFAAAIFALHPVHVESVAWITELKNTLSAVFYLGAAMAYLRFDARRKPGWYLAAIALFVLGLLSKTVTATLPAALLVVFWWQRGRLSWRRDVLPLVPFLLMGLVAGVFTAWVERKLIGAEGAAFDLTVLDRCLLAGRVVWFYLWKLVRPGELIFIYPRWQVSGAVWWQWLFPAATLAVFAGLWALRRRRRGPLAGALFFVGTLFPVLGFCNVYPFVFSYVADHFQYLASLGVITLVAAGTALAFGRWELWGRPAAYVPCLAILATLAGLTWRQSHVYADAETLYRTTIARNPDCWMAHNNLGLVLTDRQEFDEAMVHFRRALELKANYAEAHNNLVGAYTNLGVALEGRGDVDGAMKCYRQAIEIKSDYPDAHDNLAKALSSRGDIAGAIAEFRRSAELRPNHAPTHESLGVALLRRGDIDAAIVEFRRVLELDPKHSEACHNLGVAAMKRGDVGEAIDLCRRALELEPNNAEAHNSLGVALARRGDLDEAIAHFQQAVTIRPHYNDAAENLRRLAAARSKSLTKKLGELQAALRARPDDVVLLNDIAWLLATSPDGSLRNGAEAVQLADRAVELSGGRNPAVLDTLAAAYAESGQFAKATKTAETAAASAAQQNNPKLAASLEARTRLYRQERTPFPKTGEKAE